MYLMYLTESDYGGGVCGWRKIIKESEQEGHEECEKNREGRGGREGKR